MGRSQKVGEHVIRLPWIDGHAPTVGRFWAVASAWVGLGGNVLPILPGAKSPIVSGWGRQKKRPGEQGYGPLHEQPRSFAEHGSPPIPVDVLGDWCRRFASSNVAILPASIGATVIDVDSPERLDDVLAVCGSTAFRTFSGRDGGGIHLWYRGASRSRNAITSGVDVKSTGGYVLAPGSIHHATGREYTATQELVDALQQGRLDLPPLHDAWIRGLERLGTALINPTRFDLRAFGERVGAKSGKQSIGKAIRLVADGRPYSDPGERDIVLYRVLCELATEWPHADPDAVADLFEPSAEAMESIAPCEIPIVEAVLQKWARIANDREHRSEAADETTAARRRAAWSWVGVESDATALVDDAPLVVHRGKTYYLRVGESWAGPFLRDGLTVDVLGALASVYNVDPFEDVGALLSGHGRALADLRHSLAARATTYDPSPNTLTCAAAPTRTDLAPERSIAVERLIAELTGAYAPQLTLWLAGLLRTDLPCRALILSGKPGTGKSMILAGIGRLWPQGASKMRDVLGRRFNSEVTSSGLAVADDDTSSTETGTALAAYLREGVNDRTQRLERKGHDVQRVDGCMRYAVATNDAVALIRGAVSWELNDESLHAFGDRVLHIPVVGHWRHADVDPGELVEGDALARHVLWLSGLAADHVPTDRFWVGPADLGLARLACVSSGLRGDLLVRIATEVQGGGSEWCVLGEVTGHAVVDPAGLLGALYPAPRGATLRTIAQALGGVSDGVERRRGHVRVHAVALDLVRSYAAHVGI
jgi:hypothetical protein